MLDVVESLLDLVSNLFLVLLFTIYLLMDSKSQRTSRRTRDEALSQSSEPASKGPGSEGGAFA